MVQAETYHASNILRVRCLDIIIGRSGLGLNR